MTRAHGYFLGPFMRRFQGASNFLITDATAASDGTVVVSTSATATESGRASLLVWIDRTGSIKRVASTSPFAASKILLTPDGTLWAVGRVHDDQYNTVMGADLVRRYDSNGKLSGAAVPHATFAAGEEAPAPTVT